MTFSPSGLVAAVGVPGSRIAILAGLLFIARCEFGNYQINKSENWLMCWSGGATIAGIAKGADYVRKSSKAEGFGEGYWTYNPELKRKKEEEEGEPSPNRHSSKATGTQD